MKYMELADSSGLGSDEFYFEASGVLEIGRVVLRPAGEQGAPMSRMIDFEG
jgi:hypothetical protein